MRVLGNEPLEKGWAFAASREDFTPTFKYPETHKYSWDGITDTEKILGTFTRLKEQNNSYELKRIDGHYYVYLSFSRRDEALGRARKVSLYKGKITDAGSFVEAKRRRWNGQEGVTPAAQPSKSVKNKEQVTDAAADIRPSSLKHEKTLMTALSMNGKISLPTLSKMTGLSANATGWQVKSLERRHGIRYMAELNINALGFHTFMCFIKFHGRHPSIAEMKEAAISQPKIQFAAATKGEYDMVMYILAESSGKAADMAWRMRTQSPLKSYDATWHLSPVSTNYGYVPFRDELFDTVLAERVWHKSDKSQRPQPGQLLAREFYVMKELNSNGATTFSEIDRKYGLDSGASKYAYHKLKEKRMIYRITATAEKMPMRYLSMILLKYVNGEEFNATRAELQRETMAHGKVASKYAFQGSVGSPAGILLFAPIEGDSDLSATTESLGRKIKGVDISTTIVTDVLVGSLCYRSFDGAYSRQQRILETEYGEEKAKRIDYEEAGGSNADDWDPSTLKNANSRKRMLIDFSQTEI